MLEAADLGLPASAAVRVALWRFVVSVSAFAGMRDGLAAALQVDLPGPGRVLACDGVRYLWAGPEAWLVMAEDAELEARILAAASGLAAVTDQSDGRVVFLVSGASILAKLLPVDLHEGVFGPDATALTLAGHVPVQIWREGGDFAVACFRSYAGSLHHALVEAGG